MSEKSAKTPGDFRSIFVISSATARTALGLSFTPGSMPLGFPSVASFAATGPWPKKSPAKSWWPSSAAESFALCAVAESAVTAALSTFVGAASALPMVVNAAAPAKPQPQPRSLFAHNASQIILFEGSMLTLCETAQSLWLMHISKRAVPSRRLGRIPAKFGCRTASGP
ncbi:hypothetical protein [Streptomyces cyaneofuscatus]|uniref:hypothetical protein n=1 Tax=Streptomyces cyaneofuscatus TaxID=66883 RepID=UPI00364B8C90